MTPVFGTARGGTLVTITGSMFDTVATRININGYSCPIQSISSTEIVCETAPRQEIRPLSFSVWSPGSGFASIEPTSSGVDLNFRYIDNWSDARTWLYDGEIEHLSSHYS